MASDTMRSPASITTTDLLKFAGLAFVFADHIGLFFAPDEDWWRVFGRVAAPIFFFLIGFARTSAVPMIWLALGAMLTALDFYVSDGLDDVTLNILFNFALIRFVMPVIETHVLTRRWGAPVLALFCAAMIPVAAVILEYGAEGWLWALFGLVTREAIVKATSEARLQRNLVGLFCVAVYLFIESRDFDFEPVQTAALCALMILLGVLLANFRRADAPFEAPAPVTQAFRWIGSRSLEIYAVSLFLMQLTGHLLEVDVEDDDA
ncbi:MAG: TraX family protein [Beijerinckiaceae bacterium]|nr:TraX family protein [Beijerinckiaceae bacterium]